MERPRKSATKVGNKLCFCFLLQHKQPFFKCCFAKQIKDICVGAYAILFLVKYVNIFVLNYNIYLS